MSLFSSNAAFQPTEVTRFVRNLDSGAGAILVETDAGPGYLKAIGNPGGPHVLACDLVGTHLAARLGLPTFDYALVEITELDELPFHRGGIAEPGPALITRLESGSTWGNDSGLLKRLSNPSDLSRLVGMDTWLRNVDRYAPGMTRVNFDNVFLSMETGDSTVELRAMDFTHAFTNGRDLTKRVRDIDNIKDTAVYGLFPQFKRYLDRATVRSFCLQLGQLPDGLAAEAGGLIPVQWEVSAEARKALVDFICQRARFLADTFEDTLFDPPQQMLADESEGKS